MNTFEQGLAVLSAAAYRVGSNRSQENITPPVSGAVEIGYASDPASGFEASAYQYEGRIVIAFAGTDPNNWNDLLTDSNLNQG